jgi:hypothetical protein
MSATIATVCAETAENLNRTAMVMGKGIVELLASKYGFDAAEAFEAISFEVPKKSKKAAEKKEKDAAANGSRKSSKTGPAFPLPFIGIVKAEWCQGIRTNHGLFTQCTQPKPTGDDAQYCPTCAKQAEANASGKPTYGNINDRMAAMEAGTEWRDPKDNKAVAHYANVATKLKVDLEDANAECLKVFGVDIPADLLEVKVTQRGRPKKDASAIVSDTDSATSSSEKKRGRPKKVKAIIEGGAAGDDLIAGLVAAAQESGDSDAKPKKATKAPKAELTEEEKAAKKAEAAEKRKATLASKKATQPPKAELSEEEKKAKKAEAAEKRKQAKVAKEQAYIQAAVQAALVAKGLSSSAPSSAGNSSGSESTTPVKTQPQTKPKSKPQPQPEPEPEPEAELEIEDLDEEEEPEEEIKVKVFVHPISNVKYLKTPDNILYDPNTQDEVGIYDPNTHEIQPIADDDEEDDDMC